MRVCQAFELVKKVGPWNVESKPRVCADALLAKLGRELLEPVDRAASAHARVDSVPPGADALVLRLQVEAAVEIEGRAIFVEFGPDSSWALQDKIDLLGP